MGYVEPRVFERNHGASRRGGRSTVLRLSRSLDDDGLADAHEAIAATERAIGSDPADLRGLATSQSTNANRRQKTLDAIHLASALLFEERHEVGPRVLARTTAAKRQRHVPSASM